MDGWILVSIRFLNDKMLIITETFRETFQRAFNFLLLNHLYVLSHSDAEQQTPGADVPQFCEVLLSKKKAHRR